MKKFPTVMLVVAIALHDSAGRFLMQRRPAAKQHGGLWEFPGGKVEAGETPEKALIREIAEELGIGITADDLVPAGFATAGSDADTMPVAPVILLYTCARWTGIPTPLDADELGWFAPAAFTSLERPPLDVALCNRLATAI